MNRKKYLLQQNPTKI